MLSPKSYSVFVSRMWGWFERFKRELPWRDLKINEDSKRAYFVLVSEMMLQQTQVPRVEIAYKIFIRKFPSLEALSHASNRKIILAWRGMGYNSRALRLRDAAKIIVQRFRGEFPKKYEDLILISGIGPYTAAAILNFAFDIPSPCLDTNIRRILHRVFFGAEKRDGTWKKSDAILLETAREVLDVSGKPRQWHAALMDFGSLVCTKRRPKCEICPLKKTCAAAFRVKEDAAKRSRSREPGREIAGRYVPSRIIRGRIVEFLRDSSTHKKVEEIGANVCIDWNAAKHRKWLTEILTKLKRDALIKSHRKGYALAD